MLLDNEIPDQAVHSKFGEFVKLLAREYMVDNPDRRANPRYVVTVPVKVQLVDDELNAIGPPIRAVTKDFSEGGIGLISPNPLSGTLIVEISCLSGLALCVVVHVQHCVANGFYFNAGCKFIKNVE